MTEIDERTMVEAEAAAFRRLRDHLIAERPDAQNIDLMNLAGFCRNCLARWLGEALAERGVQVDKAESRALFYGEPEPDWSAKHRREASPEALAAFSPPSRVP